MADRRRHGSLGKRTQVALLATLIACAVAAVPGAARRADCNFQGPGSLAGTTQPTGTAWAPAIPGAGDTAAIGAGDSVLVDQAESAWRWTSPAAR